MILLIGLWQKLSADQIAILEAAFLPLQQDTQELVRTHSLMLELACESLTDDSVSATLTPHSPSLQLPKALGREGSTHP